MYGTKCKHEWQTIDEYYNADTGRIEITFSCPFCGGEIKRSMRLPRGDINDKRKN